jgi:hypothetical protein
MKKDVITILGKKFEYVRIEDIKTEHPSIFIEDRNIDLCIQAIEKLDIRTVYLETTDFEYLSHPAFKNVTRLSVHGFNIDASPIQQLKNLKHLSLSNYNEEKNAHIDFGCFKNLTYLRCDMPNNYSNFSVLDQLEDLSITGFKETDLSVISKFTKLKKLELINPMVKSFKGIKHIGQVKISEARNLETIEGIEDASDTLTDLDIFFAPKLSNYSPIGRLKKLQKLRIRHAAQISDIESFSNLKQLRELTLQTSGKAGSLYFLDELHKLKSVSVDASNIKTEEKALKPYIQKLQHLNDLEKVITWDGIYGYLNETGKKYYTDYFEALQKRGKITELQAIRNDFQFYQEGGFYEEMGYKKKDCALIDTIIFNLIEKLENNKDATEKQKLTYFKSYVLAINKVDDKLQFIETGEREYLCDTLDDIATAAGIDVAAYDDDIAGKWRTW